MIASLSTGAKLILGAGGLLFVDLFLTWQNTRIEFGPKNTITTGLDGWDAWGLLMGIATLGLIALVVVRQLNEELVFEHWDRVTLALGALVLAVAVLKNLRDSDSTWASYLGVALAAVVAVGAYLDYTTEREPVARGPAWRPRDRTLERASATQQAATPDESPPRW